jgi:RHS repeat-associated protein
MGVEGGVTIVNIGNYYEWHGTITDTIKYYYAGAERVAMRTGTADPLWLLGDHLGSTSVVANYDGTIFMNGSTPARQGYKAWGEQRFPTGASPLPTTFRYTGQREGSFGLYFYEARWYDSALGRFSSPDTVIPEASQGVQAWDRYAYSYGNPVKYIDPSGHTVDCMPSDKSCKTPTKETTYNDIAKRYGITFSGKGWTPQRMLAVIDAAYAIGIKFMSYMQAGNASSAFSKVMGPIVWEIKGSGNGCMSNSCGAQTEFTMQLVAHEIGHLFANRRSNIPYENLASAQQKDDIGFNIFGSFTPGEYTRTTNGYKSGGIPDMYHGPKTWSDWNSNANNTGRNEDFADMFMNWTFDSFDYSSKAHGAGTARMEWMTTNMVEFLQY